MPGKRRVPRFLDVFDADDVEEDSAAPARAAGRSEPDEEEDEEHEEPAVLVEGDDDVEPAGPELPIQEPRESRKQRRRNRYTELAERADRAERERDDAMRLANAALLRETHGQRAAPVQGTQGQDPNDPIARELQTNYREQDVLNREFGLLTEDQRGNQEVVNGYVARQRELDERRQELITQRALSRGQGGQQAPAGNYTVQRIQMDYPDVAADARAMNHARAYCEMKQHEGRALDWTLVQEAMERTRVQFGMSRAPRPTENSRQRYVGAPRGNGLVSAGGGRPTIRMNEHYRAQARALHPNDPPKVAYQKWANTVGRELLKRSTT